MEAVIIFVVFILTMTFLCTYLPYHRFCNNLGNEYRELSYEFLLAFFTVIFLGITLLGYGIDSLAADLFDILGMTIVLSLFSWVVWFPFSSLLKRYFKYRSEEVLCDYLMDYEKIANDVHLIYEELKRIWGYDETELCIDVLNEGLVFYHYFSASKYFDFKEDTWVREKIKKKITTFHAKLPWELYYTYVGEEAVTTFYNIAVMLPIPRIKQVRKAILQERLQTRCGFGGAINE